MSTDGSAPSAEAQSLAQLVVLDFGSQYSHLIVRRIRDAGVFCELFACNVDAAVLEPLPLKGVILSGGPYSVYDEGAPHVGAGVWELIRARELPMLGICYGLQEMCRALGGTVEPCEAREFGRSALRVAEPDRESALFAGLPVAEGWDVWMSHGDKVTALPEGFHALATSDNSELAAVADPARRFWGLQFHPEVTHTQHGAALLANFVHGVCGCERDWDVEAIAERFVAELAAQVGPTAHVIGAVSGGVDSSVAAVLLHRAIGDRFHAVFVDNGVLRLNEAEEVQARLRDRVGINLTTIDAAAEFLDALEGVEDPEQKRRIIGGKFIDVFQRHAESMTEPIEFLLQGTLYPDVIESISFKGPSATIKTHHNVGGLPASMHLRLIEPLRHLFKDEVRRVGLALGIERESIWRHPFPGPGLAIRILGAVSREGLHKLRQADHIFISELRATGHYDKIAQAFAVLLPVKSVGVMGDGRTYEQVVTLRAVQSDDYMTADFYHLPFDILANVSGRIINEVRGVNRVAYDVSSKPPATIEWE